MVFSTPVFLFYFLALTLLVYYLVPRALRNVVLLVSSLAFYYWGERIYVCIMLASTLIDYSHGLLVSRCKARGNDRGARAAVASSVVFNLALLGFFKYWDFLAGSLATLGLPLLPILGVHLPIGISFYTFQTMSYTIDVYRGDARAQRNILNFGTFVTLFPQLIAGPILKYKDLGGQVDARECTAARFASGVRVFVIGLAKKLLLANNVGQIWDAYKALEPGQLSVGGAWLGVLAFTFQIYFDFSGYSDMATGLGRMFGFEFLENFRYPYIARSVTEFWRRWHISLSSWFREYLYIPLGGNRRGRGRQIFNLFLVWACTGLWHGASWNFLAWGMYYFVLLMLEKLFLLDLLSRSPGVLRHIYTLFCVLLGWAIFALEDFGQLGGYLRVLFGLAGRPLADARLLYEFGRCLPVLCVAALAATPLPARAFARLTPGARRGLSLVLTAAGLFFCTAYLVAGTYNPFLYFRF